MERQQLLYQLHALLLGEHSLRSIPAYTKTWLASRLRQLSNVDLHLLYERQLGPISRHIEPLFDASTGHPGLSLLFSHFTGLENSSEITRTLNQFLESWSIPRRLEQLESPTPEPMDPPTLWSTTDVLIGINTLLDALIYTNKLAAGPSLTESSTALERRDLQALLAMDVIGLSSTLRQLQIPESSARLLEDWTDVPSTLFANVRELRHVLSRLEHRSWIRLMIISEWMNSLVLSTSPGADHAVALYEATFDLNCDVPFPLHWEHALFNPDPNEGIPNEEVILRSILGVVDRGAAALLRSHLGGYERALHLMRYTLNLPGSDWENLDELRNYLARSLPARAGRDDRHVLVAKMARLLVQSPPTGPRLAVPLLVAELGMPNELIDVSPEMFPYFLDFLNNLAQQESERFRQNSELVELLATTSRLIPELGVHHAQAILRVWFRLPPAGAGTIAGIRDSRLGNLGRSPQFHSTVATMISTFAETSPLKAWELLTAADELYSLPNNDEAKRLLVRYPRVYARYFHLNNRSCALIARTIGNEEMRDMVASSYPNLLGELCGVPRDQRANPRILGQRARAELFKSSVDPADLATIVADLATFWSTSTATADMGRMLMQGFIGEDPVTSVSEPMLAKLPSWASIIALYTVWLSCARLEDLPFLACDGFVHSLVQYRDMEVMDLRDDRDYRTLIQPFRNLLIRWGIQNRGVGTHDQDDSDFQTLMFLEQIEHRATIRKSELEDNGSALEVESRVNWESPPWQPGHWPWVDFSHAEVLQANISQSGDSLLLGAPIFLEQDTGSESHPDTKKARLIWNPANPKEVTDVCNPSEELIRLLPQGAVWVRMLFLDDGRIWWRVYSAESTTPSRPIASFTGDYPDARGRLATADRQRELRSERHRSIYLHLQAQNFHLGTEERSARRIACAISDYLQGNTGPWEEFRNNFTLYQLTTKALRWLGEKYPFTGDVADRLFLEITDSYPASLPDEVLREFHLTTDAWKRHPSDIVGKSMPDDWYNLQQEGIAQAYIETATRELQLSNLIEVLGPERAAETDLVFSMDGPLITVPVAFLETNGKPLFSHVASVSRVLSLSQLRRFDNQAEASAQTRADDQANLLAAYYLPRADTVSTGSFPWLHSKLLELGNRFSWGVVGMADRPSASVENVRNVLSQKQRPFTMAILGGHGSVRHGGIGLADNVRWRGNGADLSSLDMSCLISCAVGRMFWDDDGLEVSGLITELEASGCRSCIAAKWVIPAHPSCQLIAFFCEQYLEARRRADSDRFLRARAFNTALKQMSRPLGEPFAAAGQIPAWVAAAFDFYGRG